MKKVVQQALKFKDGSKIYYATSPTGNVRRVIDYAATDEIPKDTEVIELAKTTTIIGEKTEIEVDIVAAVIDQKVLITRTDWFEDCGKVPENAGFVFDLRLVRNR